MKGRVLIVSILVLTVLVTVSGQGASAQRLTLGVPAVQETGRFQEEREIIAGQRAEFQQILASAREKAQLIQEKLPQLRRTRDVATLKAVLSLRQENLRLRIGIIDIRMTKMDAWQSVAAAIEQGDAVAIRAGLSQVIEHNEQLLALSGEYLGNLDAILALLP